MTKIRALARLGSIVALCTVPAIAAASPQGRAVPEASIAFANSGGIADWQASDDASIYVMDRTGRWYLARFQGRCYRLPLENNVAFDTGISGLFDRFSAVVTENGRCPVESVIRVDRPAVVGLKGVASAAN